MSVVNVVSSSEASQVARSSHRHCVQYVITISASCLHHSCAKRDTLSLAPLPTLVA